MSQLHIANALLVAKGTYHEQDLQTDFMAVAALNDALVQATGQHLDLINGFHVKALKNSLQTIVMRNQHSGEFADLIHQGRKLALHGIKQDLKALGDLKYWHDMDAVSRLESCQRFADLLKGTFSSHVRLPPDAEIKIKDDFDDKPVIYVSYHGQLSPETFTAKLGKTEMRSSGETIYVNTHRNSRFENGAMTYAAIYGQYISLIERNIATCVVRDIYADNLNKLSHDVQLWKNASQQKAFVDPLLHDIHALQFSTLFIKAEERAMEESLQDLVENHSENVPERIRLSARQKLGLLVGSVMGWNP